MSKLGFEKFINKKSAAKIKEEHRQEKRKSKAALRAAGDEFRRQKLEKQRGGNTASRDNENFRGGKSYRERNTDAREQRRTPQRGPDGRFTGSRDRNERGDRDNNRNSKNTRDGNTRRPERPNRHDHDHDRQTKPGKYAQKNSRHDDSRQTEYNAKPVKKQEAKEEDAMPLNKYIAHSGICGRREAAELVKQGQVQVNGDIVFEPATKVTPTDTVKLKGKKLSIQIKHYYFLLNKPKDHITTTKDEKGRRTVLDLFRDVDAKHLYPVGRLDRNTTGVLLITNDGELAQQLTHPSFEVKKIYEATLDRPLAKKDLDTIASGLTLEDGDIKADQVGYPDSKNKAIVGIEIHSGKNRIVRRIFEHLGYEVKKLDRVMFAGLTKKNVERGKWRYLSEKEIRVLKYMNAGGTKKARKAADAIEEAEKEALPTPVKKVKGSSHAVKADNHLSGKKLITKKQTAGGPAKKTVRKNSSASGKTTRKEKH